MVTKPTAKLWLGLILSSAFLGGCQVSEKTSISGDTAMGLKRLGVSEISTGCYAEHFNYLSHNADSINGVDFSLKNAWDGEVDLSTVSASFENSGARSTDIEIAYCLNGHSLPASGLGAKGGDKMVAVCHVPPGNPANAHTIVISEQGWQNGHKNHHDDYLGECGSLDDDDDDVTQPPADDPPVVTNPPDDGTSNPPDDPVVTNPPDDGTTNPPADDPVVTSPPDDSTTDPPGDDPVVTNPGDTGGAWDGTCSNPELCGAVEFQ